MFSKIKTAVVDFFGKVKNKAVLLASKVKKDFWKFINYMRKLDVNVLIAIGVMLIIIIGLLITVIIYSIRGSETSGKPDVIEFSANYDGNLINIYSDELNFFPYGNMAFSNDGANKKSIQLIDGYLEMSKPFDLKEEFTFQTWIKVNDLTIKNPIIFGRASSNGDVHNGPVTIKFFNDYKTILCDMTFIDEKGEYISHSFSADDFINTDELLNIWHHIAVTFNKNGYSLYFDSKEICTLPLPENLKAFKEIASNKNPFFIGIGENGNMKAMIDETKFFSYHLPAEEIKKEYEKAHPVKTHRIVINYTDETDSVTLNGEGISLEGKILKDVHNETYLVPLKSVMEFIGGTYIEDENEKDKLDISFKNKTISLWLMDTNAITDGIHTKLDFYPQEIDDIIYVPAIAFSKLFNLEVSIKENSIIINY